MQLLPRGNPSQPLIQSMSCDPSQVAFHSDGKIPQAGANGGCQFAVSRAVRRARQRFALDTRSNDSSAAERRTTTSEQRLVTRATREREHEPLSRSERPRAVAGYRGLGCCSTSIKHSDIGIGLGQRPRSKLKPVQLKPRADRAGRLWCVCVCGACPRGQRPRAGSAGVRLWKSAQRVSRLGWSQVSPVASHQAPAPASQTIVDRGHLPSATRGEEPVEIACVSPVQDCPRA